jgi:hypothetical protein
LYHESNICYGNGKFVIVSKSDYYDPDYSGAIKAAYSIDGIKWYETKMPSQDGWDSVCYGD